MLRATSGFIVRAGIRGIRTATSSTSVSRPICAKPPVHAAIVRPAFSRNVACAMSAAAGSVSNERIRIRASHILVKSEDLADVLLERIKGGESFADVASWESECPSKQQGGDLGWFQPQEMVAPFSEACVDNEVGALVKVKTEFGWHIVKVEEKAKLPGDMMPSDLGDILGDESKKSQYQLIDVREPDELKRADIRGGGFTNLPLSQFQQWGPQVMDGSMMDKTKPTIVMCHHGGRSMQVASFLSTQAGFTEVFNLAGGIHMYAQNVDPSVGQY